MTRGGGFFRYLRMAILGRVDGKEWLTSSPTFSVTGWVYGVDAAEGSDVSLWLVWTPGHGGCLLISDFIVQTAMNLAKETTWSSQRGSYC